MKEIGRTGNGGHIVEMGDDEYRELGRLYSAVSGNSGFPNDSGFRRGDYETPFDFTNVFHVIRAYYLNRFAVNELQGLIDEIRAKLEEKDVADKD